MDKGNLVPNKTSNPGRIDQKENGSGFNDLNINVSRFDGDISGTTRFIDDFVANDIHKTTDNDTGLISVELPPDALGASNTSSNDVSNEGEPKILHIFDDGQLSSDEIRKITNAAEEDPFRLCESVNAITDRMREGN